jgi:hypothetical protein
MDNAFVEYHMINNTSFRHARTWSAALGAICLGATTLSMVSERSLAAGRCEAPAVGIERGRYVGKTSGCNDCHTAGYLMGGGGVRTGE